MPDTRVAAEGLGFPEGPRWHEGRLWFSDHAMGTVSTLASDGRVEMQFELAAVPSGLGWRPDGTLLVVSMGDRKLVRRTESGFEEVADLGGIATFHCNDMVVDAAGRAYVGNFGFDLRGGEQVPARLARVDPDGSVHVAAEDLLFPNGTVIWPDGRTLVIAETYANRLTAFDVALDGALSNRRVWAETPGIFPDGICLDAEGCIWVASPTQGGATRFREGGVIEDRVETHSGHSYAVMLGGEDGRTLHVCTAPGLNHDFSRSAPQGRIEVIEVDVPHAGLP